MVRLPSGRTRQVVVQFLGQHRTDVVTSLETVVRSIAALAFIAAITAASRRSAVTKPETHHPVQRRQVIRGTDARLLTGESIGPSRLGAEPN